MATHAHKTDLCVETLTQNLKVGEILFWLVNKDFFGAPEDGSDVLGVNEVLLVQRCDLGKEIVADLAVGVQVVTEVGCGGWQPLWTLKFKVECAASLLFLLRLVITMYLGVDIEK